ncbi:hypothetical protein ACOACO_17375 [Nocardioides sp. CPCC 205120]|uniref:hypothetical protein n=1 Tax=Nocardioides sp. CPCC 205120 TaxID=3406462 RepID=UPI003B50591F
MQGLPDVSGERIVIYAAIGVVLLLALATATDKGLGPITRWWFSFARDRRAAAAELRAADYNELMVQVRNLRAQLTYTRTEHNRQMDGQRRAHDEQLAEVRHEVAVLRAEIGRRDRLVMSHMRWDREAARVAAAAGNPLEPPPALWPGADTT